MNASPVLTAIDGHVGKITLNRPDKRNALTPPMVTLILDALASFEANENVRVVLFQAAGTAFCAGLDLAYMRADMEKTGSFDYGRMPELFEGIARHPNPTVAVVQGAAIAGGCELALHCDLRVGSPMTRFAMPLAKLGLVVPAGAAERLVQTVGVAIARDMLLTGHPIGGRRAEAVGLLSRFVEHDQLESTAAEITLSLASLSTTALRAMKRVIDDIAPALSVETRAQLDAERLRMSGGTDVVEGLQAFLTRHRPGF